MKNVSVMSRGRVRRGHVEGVEVEPLGLDLRAIGDLVAHADEEVGDPLLQRRQRVAGTAGAHVPRSGDVDPLLDQDAGVPLARQRLVPCLQGVSHLSAGGPDPLARLRPGLRRQGPDLPVRQGQTATGPRRGRAAPA